MLHAQMRANSSWPSPALTRPPLQTLHSAVYTTLRYPHEATEHQRLSLPRSHKNPQMRRCAAKASRSRCRFRADGAPRAYRDPLVTADVNVWVAQVGFDERREQRAHADYGNMPRFTEPSALVVLLGSAKFLCPTRGVGSGRNRRLSLSAALFAVPFWAARWKEQRRTTLHGAMGGYVSNEHELSISRNVKNFELRRTEQSTARRLPGWAGRRVARARMDERHRGEARRAMRDTIPLRGCGREMSGPEPSARAGRVYVQSDRQRPENFKQRRRPQSAQWWAGGAFSRASATTPPTKLPVLSLCPRCP